MRVAFINALGGTMLVDESRVEEYKAAGYVLAANVDSTAVEVNETEDKPKAATKRKATKKKEV